MAMGFPDSSVGKESACNAGDPGLIPMLGKSAGEGIGYPLQYSWASLMAQLVKNPPALWETWVQSLDWEDPLEKRKATHSSILSWRIPWTVYSPLGCKESDTTERLSLHSVIGLPRWLSGSELPANAGDVGLIPGLGRSLGEGNGNPLWYSCLKHPKDRRLVVYSPWGCKRSQTTMSSLELGIDVDYTTL